LIVTLPDEQYNLYTVKDIVPLSLTNQIIVPLSLSRQKCRGSGPSLSA
jgi:hypothetical protein